MIYIVTYDLSQPGQNYDKLLNLIKEEINWARLGGSSYLVESNSTSVELRDKYKTDLDSNDQLYVGAVSRPAAWIGMPDDVTEWIKKKL